MHHTRRSLLCVVAAAALLCWARPIAQQPPTARVSDQELLEGLKPDGSRWVTFGGDYTNRRHSPLTAITPANVHRLVPQWTFQTATLGNFEATPLLRDNVLYVTGPQNMAWAIDARDPLGQTALHWAVMCGGSGAVQALLELGADPNMVDSNGVPPLWTAEDDFGLDAIAAILRHHGATKA